MSCINIDVVFPTASPGGLQRVAIEEAKYLQNRGHNVRLISLIRPVNPWSELLQGISVEYLADFRGPTAFISEMLNRNLFLLKKIKSDADICICHNLPSCYSVVRSIKVPNSSRVIAYIQDPIDFTLTGNIFPVLFRRSPSLKRTFAMRWLRDVDVILLNSRQAQQVLTKELGLDSRILPPTLVSFANKEPPSRREKFFLSVGRIGFHPTYKILFNILKRIPEMEVVVAGSWSHSTKNIVELFSSDLDVKHRVHMAISPTDEELERLYRSARAFLYPGKENFGLSALEAASYGCPIVICRESGICDLLGESVVMPAQDDTESFVKLALHLLSDEQYAIAEGLRLREILKRYDSSYHMENFREIVEQIPRQTSSK